MTVGGITHLVQRPFLVLATQNPIEYEGTFPLPEAQVDRFMMRISLGYPTQADEIAILNSQQTHHPIEDIEQVISAEDLMAAQRAVKEAVSYTHLRAHETVLDLVCRLLLENKKTNPSHITLSLTL